MAQRQNPQEYFRTSVQVRTQEPVPVALQTPPMYAQYPPTIDPNLTIVIVGVIAIVGVLGLFAILAFDKKCRC